MIHVIAVITARPGQRGRLLEAFNQNVPAVRAETGCIEYGAATDLEGGSPPFAAWGEDSFVVIEKWATLDDLKAHGAAPHMLAHRARVKELQAGAAVYVMSPATP